MGYQGNYPPSTPLTSSQIGAGAVTPTSLSSIGPYWDASGNVGVGTSSPANNAGYQTLTINGTSGGVAQIQVAGTNIFQIFSNATANYLNGQTALPMAFFTNAVERMRIDSSGNVGVGTSSPAQKLHVSSTGDNVILSSGGSGAGGYLAANGNGRSGLTGALKLLSYSSGAAEVSNASNAAMLFSTNDTERMRIDSSGNVGINSTNPTQYDTSGGRILNIRGTASNSSPATLFMNGSSSTPGAGYYTQEVFSIGVTASQEISRVTGTGANGFRSMIRISLCGHTGAKGNGHIYAMYYWDGGTAAPVQIFRYDSGTNIPGLSFNTSTSNVLITNLSSSDGSNLFQGVMTIEYFLPIDFASSTYTIS